MGRVPRITVSYAQSLDGRIATAAGQSRWISGTASLRLAHRLRRDHEVLLVGIGTVLQDDPQLTCRLPGSPRNPVRAVLDSQLRLPLESRLVRTATLSSTIVFTAAPARADRRRDLEAAGVQIVELPAEADGRVGARSAAEHLARQGYGSLFVEGGARVITSFLKAGIVRRLLVVVAPLLIGKGVEAVGDLGVVSLDQALRPARTRVRRFGADLVWELGFDVDGAD
jgi:riboflavin-specific deaminase-like protein